MDKELLCVFQEEATELIRNIISNFDFFLIDHEQKKITHILRDLHTLKGSAQFIAHENLVKLIHALESVFKLDHVNSLLENETSVVSIQASLNFITDIVSQIQTTNQLMAPLSLINQLIMISEKNKTTNKEIKQKIDEETQPIIRSTIFKLNLKDIEFISNKIHALTCSYTEIKNHYQRQTKTIDDIHEMLTNHQMPWLDSKQFKKNDNIKKWLEQTSSLIEEAKIELEHLSERMKNVSLINKHQQNTLKQLNNKLIQIRLDSFDNYIPRFKIMTNQIAKKLNKEVELIIEPSNTEIDKQMFEKLMPAFEHLIRNAIDHGIEPSSIRKVYNKTTLGHVFISIKRKGQQITISLRDDGAGLDLSSIKQKAIDNGLIKPDTALDESCAIQLLLQPGFTTRNSISDISGRGIGMDVVNHIVKSLGGRIEITHKRKEFTQIDLIMPATISQHSSIVFEMNNIFYAVSLPNLIGVTRINTTYNLDEKIMYGNQHYTIINSAKMMKDKISFQSCASHQNVVIINNDSSPYALVVDKMLGTHDLVIQPIPKAIKGSDAFQGAAILPDGMVVYCIEPAYFHLFESTQKVFNT